MYYYQVNNTTWFIKPANFATTRFRYWPRCWILNFKPRGTSWRLRDLFLFVWRHWILSTPDQKVRFLVSRCFRTLTITSDRYQWASILSRFWTGWVLVFLLLLNIGRYQYLWATEAQEKYQAGVFLWLSAWVWMIQPTYASVKGS